MPRKTILLGSGRGRIGVDHVCEAVATLDVLASKLRAEIVHVLDAAAAQGRSVTDVRDALIQLAKMVTPKPQ